MEDRYGYMNPQRRSEEFKEEDVWDLMNSVELRREKSLLLISRKLPSAARMIPGAQKVEESQEYDHNKKHQHSAPVSIPDWSKIYGKRPRRNVHDGDGDVHDGDDDDDVHDGDDDDDVGGGMAISLPPHEWLARKLARSQISSFSVCEGAGRTLKGRDLSRVRNSVLSKTGFI